MIPEIIHPTIFIDQPSTGKKLSFRRYIVKEEKILLFAKESKDINEIFRAIKDVVKLCSKEELNIEEWPMFDLEYVYLILRSLSVNSVEDFTVIDNEDEKEYKLFVQFDKIKVQFKEDAPPKNIKVNDNIIIVMRYPRASIYDDKEISNRIRIEGIFPLVVDCVEKVFNNDEAIDMTKEEIGEFLDSLDIKTFEKIKEFLFSVPSLKYTVTYKNSLGNDREITFNSLLDFFLYL